MQILDVHFPQGAEVLRGNLFLPGDAPIAAITATGPLTSVKEQVVTNYARLLSGMGYAVLAFDHSHFGASTGLPRQFESPFEKVVDIRASIDFLNEHESTRGLPVLGLGVCAGAGYMAQAVASDPRFRGFAGVAGYYADAALTRKSMGSRFDEAIAAARAARVEYEHSGAARCIPAVGLDGEVAMPLRDAYEYYSSSRGAVPTYINAFAVQSREQTLNFDAQSAASLISVPTLLVHSPHALAPSLAEKFYESLRPPKEIIWNDAPKQTAFYDDPQVLSSVCAQVQRFFAGLEHLQ
jgi:fermentation-respiration switch protein FrsA (DUF1100 family)